MSFSALPTDVITGWASDGTDVTIPIANVAQLDSAEADPVTGDSRKIYFALIEQWYQWYVALATADRPSKMTIAKSVSQQSDGSQRNSYTIAFTTDVTALEVVAED